MASNTNHHALRNRVNRRSDPNHLPLKNSNLLLDNAKLPALEFEA